MNSRNSRRGNQKLLGECLTKDAIRGKKRWDSWDTWDTNINSLYCKHLVMSTAVPNFTASGTGANLAESLALPNGAFHLRPVELDSFFRPFRDPTRL